MQHYTAVLTFDEETKSKLLLIVKRKPEWQAGKLNGIGGKIEEGELPIDCVLREFKEETASDDGEIPGVELGFSQKFLKLGSDANNWRVYFYWSTLPISVMQEIQKTTANNKEKIVVVSLDALNILNLITNMAWIIPMGHNAASYRDSSYYVVEEWN